jgi:hypothetical protein
MDMFYILETIALLFLPIVGFVVGVVMFDRRHRLLKNKHGPLTARSGRFDTPAPAK